MTRQVRLIAVVCLALTAALTFADTAPAGAGQVAPLRRFALVMGSSGGGPNLPRLRYALSDARSFAAVMTELGGVRDEDLVLLSDPDLAGYRQAAGRLQAAASSAGTAGQKCEFILYYSGHSDDYGLLLGKDRLAYSELRSSMDQVPAAVRVAILDSCSSGSLTRAKGGSAKPAFLYDASSDMKGHAYITSSSAEEAAQESDRIGASYFTYHLVSALRGAADPDGEGRVTLNEAYAYAFRETLASTENSKYGPQHAAYEINLTGSGDLVVTDLRTAKAGLDLDEDLAGKLYLRDAKGNLVVELDKSEGKRMEIGLPPGRYGAVLVDRDDRLQASVTVSDGSRSNLAESDFRALATEPTVARGASSVDEPAGAPDAASAGEEPARATLPEESALAGARDSQGAAAPEAGAASAAPEGPKAAAAPEQAAPPLSPAAKAAASTVTTVQNAIETAVHKVLNSPGLGKATPSARIIGGDASVGGHSFSFGYSLIPDFSRGIFSSETDKAVSLNLFWGQARDLRGLQFASLLNADSGDERGLQLSIVANAVKGRASGLQVAAAANFALGGFGGVQLGLVNATGGPTKGIQLGLVNAAGGETGGAQLGLVNVADQISGIQVGLVNVANRISGVPIGLINIESGGVFSPQLWTEGGTSLRTGLAFGTRHIYTLASVGLGLGTDAQAPSASLGLGGRITIGRFFGDIDLSWRQIFGAANSLDFSNESSRLEARILAGFPSEGRGLIAGGALEGLVPGISKENDGSKVTAFRVQPTFIVGMKL